MKFLLDVCASSRPLSDFLAVGGHEVVSAIEIDPTASDEYLMELARQNDSILITLDKDFGELIFVRQLPHGPVIRLVEMTISEQVDAIRELLESNSAHLSGPVLITLTMGRMRIRRSR